MIGWREAMRYRSIKDEGREKKIILSFMRSYEGGGEPYPTSYSTFQTVTNI